jgi:hypothetical protein
VSDQTNGKCVLEMVGNWEILVHVNLTEFLYGRSVSGEVNLRTFRAVSWNFVSKCTA